MYSRQAASRHLVYLSLLVSKPSAASQPFSFVIPSPLPDAFLSSPEDVLTTAHIARGEVTRESNNPLCVLWGPCSAGAFCL